jgi:pilus assembly protein CpaB
MRRWMTPAIAIVVALLGTVVLAAYVQTAEERALAGEQLVTVLVTTEDVPRGTAAAELAPRVRIEQVPRKLAPSGAVHRIEALEDRVTSVDLVTGEALVEQRFAAPGVSGVPAAAGMLEITLALDAARALGGTAAPGDVVGVLASFPESASGPARTELVLDDVMVTRVQVQHTTAVAGAFDEDGADPPRATVPDPSRPVMMTLAVPPDAATVLVHAAEHGDVWLAGRPSGDDTAVATVVGAR